MQNMFSSCSGLTTLDVNNFNTSKVTTMQNMFYGCSDLTTIYVSEFDSETNSGWTTSAVTNSTKMFGLCTKIVGGNGTTFNSSYTDKTYAVIDTAETPGYLTNINGNQQVNRLISASSVAATGAYLKGTIKKNKIETIEFKLGKEQPSGTIVESFDASEKQDESIMAYYTDTDGDGLYELTFASDGIIAANEDAKYLFQNLIKLAKINFENFSTYGVTNMRYMFYYCSSLTTLDLRKFDTSKVTSMKFMFYNCSSLTTLDVSKFNTSNVTEMISMFGGCSGLTTLDVSKFNTSKVTNMTSMFFGCTSLTKLDLSSYSTSSITAISGMFQNCSSLTTIDLSKFDISKVTNLNAMFSGCSSLTTIYVSEFNSETNTGWTTSAVTNSSNMFSNCTKIVGGNGTTFNSSYTDKTYAVIDKTGTPGYLTNIKDKP